MREELHDQRRTKILASARAIFLDKGFARAKVEDVARGARVANATVYTYFETKALLFEAVTVGAFEPYEGLFDRIERSIGEPPAVLTEFGLVYFRFMADPYARGVYRVVSAEVAHTPELGAILYQNAHRMLGGVLKRLLEGFHRRGDLDIPDIQVAARLLQGMIEHVTLTISMLQGNEAEPLHPAETYVAEAVRLFLAGYRPAAAA
jgi:AcrR family transcriptional regulator